MGCDLSTLTFSPHREQKFLVSNREYANLWFAWPSPFTSFCLSRLWTFARRRRATPSTPCWCFLSTLTPTSSRDLPTSFVSMISLTIDQVITVISVVIFIIFTITIVFIFRVWWIFGLLSLLGITRSFSSTLFGSLLSNWLFILKFITTCSRKVKSNQ